MLKLNYVKESRWNYWIASEYFDERCAKAAYYGNFELPFTFEDIEYFTVNRAPNGITETRFYDKNNKYLFNYID